MLLITDGTQSILGKSGHRKDRITNVEVRARIGQSMDNMLRERRLSWLGHVMWMDHQRIPQQALYYEVPGYREDQVDHERTGGTQSTKTCKRWGSAGRKQRWQLLTDTDGVECGPMCWRQTWMWDESITCQAQGLYTVRYTLYTVMHAILLEQIPAISREQAHDAFHWIKLL